ncbi:glycosyltransferase family 4 protein [Actinomyces wuliandei]|uniref:glycosyltransferase family 4 protein n=1 Tax=Actinomyces wuliandei TaxID=2057743 RepID=UPI0019D4B8B4|nr:glycosyltransferase family 4 protein [Actinomyces wuliandei]
MPPATGAPRCAQGAQAAAETEGTVTDPASPRTRVLGFGTYDARTHPRVAVLLDGLRDNGLTVRELDRPLGLGTAQRVAILRQPWRLPVLAGRLAARWSALALGSRRFRGARAPDVLLVGYMGHFDVLLARVLYPRTTIVLDHLVFASGTARDRGEGGTRVWLLEGLDTLATKTADVVVVDTHEHAARLEPGARARAVVVPVGAPQQWYDSGQRARQRRLAHEQAPGTTSTTTRATGSTTADGSLPAAVPARPLSVVFYGMFTPLQGTPTIARALRILADRADNIRATLIGTGQDRCECERVLRGVETVEWHDWVEPARLPDLVARHDVCLGIMGTTSKALDVVPNKVYQGMAAGCAVVTSDTPPQRRALGQAAVLVPPGSAEALAQALERLASSPQTLEQARRRATAAAQAFTPVRAVHPLEHVLTVPGGTRRREVS